MKRHVLFSLVLMSALATLIASAQYEPPNAVKPDEAKLKEIDARMDKLKDLLKKMREKGIQKGTSEPIYVDVEVFLKAAEWTLKYNEFYTKDSADWTLAALDNGMLRASQSLRGEIPWENRTGHTVIRGYRSAVDDSVQPYAVTYPADYGKDTRKRWRLDVVLHGRSATLTEVAFIHQHEGKAAPKDLDYVKIDIYGRGNNAYRWAGETDINEVLDNFINTERLVILESTPSKPGERSQPTSRDLLIDTNRVVLRGFSMGGAGSWHLGLHRPDQWVVVGPGAGFTTTKGYVGKFPEPLTPTQEATLHIYDAVDYAENIANVPVVAYAGSEDKQLQASRNVEEALKKSGVKGSFTLLIGQGLEHQFPAEWQKKAEDEYRKYVEKGRPAYPNHVHFVTYTLKYPVCYWANIMALDKHYERTLVDGDFSPKGYNLKTANVRVLDVMLPISATRNPYKVSIDGQEMEVKPSSIGNALHLFLEKNDGRWRAILPERYMTDRLRTPQKSQGLQGPIDDAFMSRFLVVRGTGKPWHDATQQYADADMKRFTDEWSKFMRGDLEVKDDVNVTAEDIATHHLILFGDPASNSLIEQVMTGLPFKWTRDKITWDGKEYAASEHVPVLIYPSPLNPEHYVVLNSGHTFHASDFIGTNALLYPRLGDHAILKLDKTKKDPLAAEVVRPGLFDEFWRFASKQ
jgi:hypothetical protein